MQCRRPVTCNRSLSGVQNRNHCPHCLYSRHLDWRQPGDRLAACKSAMRPVGLTLKRSHNKYASKIGGEVMIIHRCVECGKVDLNRIAADDDDRELLRILDLFPLQDSSTMEVLIEMEIEPLRIEDFSLMRLRLYGSQPVSAG